MEQVGLALEDLANIGDDFDAMHSIFGGMVRILLLKISFLLFLHCHLEQKHVWLPELSDHH